MQSFFTSIKSFNAVGVAFLVFGCSNLPPERSAWIYVTEAIGPKSAEGLRCVGSGWKAEATTIVFPIKIRMQIPPTPAASITLRNCAAQNPFTYYSVNAVRSIIDCVKKSIPIDDKTITTLVTSEMC
jgi:hypothetical protein